MAQEEGGRRAVARGSVARCLGCCRGRREYRTCGTSVGDDSARDHPATLDDAGSREPPLRATPFREPSIETTFARRRYRDRRAWNLERLLPTAQGLRAAARASSGPRGAACHHHQSGPRPRAFQQQSQQRMSPWLFHREVVRETSRSQATGGRARCGDRPAAGDCFTLNKSARAGPGRADSSAVPAAELSFLRKHYPAQSLVLSSRLEAGEEYRNIRLGRTGITEPRRQRLRVQRSGWRRPKRAPRRWRRLPTRGAVSRRTP